MVGIQCVDQVLQTWLDGNSIYEEKNEHRNELLDPVWVLNIRLMQNEEFIKRWVGSVITCVRL